MTLSKPEWLAEAKKLAPVSTLSITLHPSGAIYAETKTGSEKIMQLPELNLGLKYLAASFEVER